MHYVKQRYINFLKKNILPEILSQQVFVGRSADFADGFFSDLAHALLCQPHFHGQSVECFFIPVESERAAEYDGFLLVEQEAEDLSDVV